MNARNEINTEFGVRYLDEVIREAVITASIDFYSSEGCIEMKSDEMLVVALHNQEEYSYHLREMTEDEREYYSKFWENDRIERKRRRLNLIKKF